jgi:hypothetical protein
MGGICSMVKCIQNFVAKPEGKRQLVRSKRRWEDPIRMGLIKNREGSCGLDSSGLR